MCFLKKTVFGLLCWMIFGLNSFHRVTPDFLINKLDNFDLDLGGRRLAACYRIAVIYRSILIFSVCFYLNHFSHVERAY